MSFDAPALNAAFSDFNAFPYPLWSDLGRELAVRYGAADTPKDFFAKRVTILIDPYGRAVGWWPSVNPNTHPQQALDELTLLLGGAPE